MTQEQANTILRALDLWERDMAFIGGATLTDRPDLPLSPATSWKMNFSKEWQAMLDARAAVIAAAPHSSFLRIDGNIHPQMMRQSGPARYAGEPLESKGAGTPKGGRDA